MLSDINQGSKQYFRLVNSSVRARAREAVALVPDGYVVTIQDSTRSLEQNSLLWSLLSDISKQVEWYGRHLSSEDWKNVFTASLRTIDVVPGLDGNFVALGQSTSKMGKKMFSDLVELIYAFGAEHEVKWTEDKEVK